MFNVAETHVCRLKQRLDISLGRVRWSLPRKERCFCQEVIVVSLRTTENRHCPGSVGDLDLWFTDNPIPLTNRSNWKREKLDDLLDRAECCKFDYVPYLAVVITHDDWWPLLHFLTFPFTLFCFVLVIWSGCSLVPAHSLILSYHNTCFTFSSFIAPLLQFSEVFQHLEGKNSLHKINEICHLYCIFSSVMSFHVSDYRTFWKMRYISLLLRSLALSKCSTLYKKRTLSKGANVLSKMVFKTPFFFLLFLFLFVCLFVFLLVKKLKISLSFGLYDFVQISPACGTNTFPRNVWRDFRLLMSASATIKCKMFFR